MDIDEYNFWGKYNLGPNNYRMQTEVDDINHELFWGKDSRGRNLLLFEYDEEIPEVKLPNFKYFSLEYDIHKSGRGFQVILDDLDNITLFGKLCLDIIQVVASSKPSSPSEVIHRIIQRTQRAHDFFTYESQKKLSDTDQMALIGELIVLEEYLLKSNISALDCVHSWALRGPAPKDFIINQIGIEAKAGRGDRSKINISNADQLDLYKLDYLFLCVTDLDRATNVHENSFSLADIATRIKEKLMEKDYNAFEEYQNKLNAKDFYFEQEYEEQYWLKGPTIIYKIESDFPAITRSNLPTAISEVRYQIDLNECEDFIIDPNNIIDYINDDTVKNKSSNNTSETKPQNTMDLIGSGENKTVEFKATFNTPIEDSNPKNLTPKELKKDLETEVLMTIAAFLNSDGGTLLIGVYEDKTQDKAVVIGIESDERYESNDKYSRMIGQHIQNRIGINYNSLISIDFEEHNSKNICIIKCPGASVLQEKKWGPAPLKKEAKTTLSEEQFYIRGEGRSDQITGGVLTQFMHSWKW